MAEEVKGGEKHSLTASIGMDFSSAMKEAESFKEKVDTVNSAFKDLSQQVDKVAESASKFELRIGEKIAQAIDDIKNGRVIGINASSILSKVEDAIASALVSGKVDLQGDLSPIKVNITDQQWKEMTAEAKKNMEKAILETDILKGKVFKPVKLNVSVLNQLNDELSRKIHDVIDNNLKFDWEKQIDEATGKEVIPKIDKLLLTKEHWERLRDNVRDRFLNEIANPNNIIIEDVEPITFDSSRLQMAVTKIKNAIGDLDTHLAGVNFDELANLPNLSKEMLKFRQSLQNTVDQIIKLDQELKSLRLDGDADKLQTVVQKLQNLRGTIVGRVGVLMDSIAKDIETIPIGTAEFAHYKAMLGNIDSIVTNHVEAQINSIVMGLAQHLGIDPSTGKSVKTKQLDGQYLASLRGVQELLLASAQTAIAGIADADLGIDFNLIVNMYRDWSEQMRVRMAGDTQKELAKLTAQLVASKEEVLKAFSESISDAIKLVVNQKEIGEVTVKIPAEAIKSRLEDQLQGIITDIVKEFKPVIDGELDPSSMVKLPKSTIAKITNSLKTILTDQATALLERMKSEQSGVEITTEDVAKLDATLYNESKELVNLVINQATQTVRRLSESVESSGFKSFNSEERARIQAELDSAIARTVSEFAEAFDSAFSAFSITASTASELRKQIAQEINRAIAKSDVSLKGENEPLVLVGVVEKAEEKLRQALLTKIEAWNPKVKPFKVDIDEPVKAVKIAIQNALRDVAHSVIAGTGGIVDGVNAVYMNPKDLHRDVRRAMATADGFDRVSDWEKAFKDGVLLESVTGKTMSAGVQAVLNKFHQAIAKNTRTAIQSYKDALDLVDIQPDITSVHNVVRRIGEILDSIQFRMVDALTKNLEEFYRGALREMKGLRSVTPSFGFDKVVDAESAYRDRQAGGADESVATRRRFPLDRNVPVVLPEGMDEWDLLTAFQKQARIAQRNTKNRFLGSALSDDNMAKLHTYLDTVFIPKVDQAVAKYKEVVENEPDSNIRAKALKDLRDAYRDANLELKYTIETFRELLHGNKIDKQALGMMDKVDSFRKDRILEMEGMRTKYYGKLSPDQYGDLNSYLEDIQSRIDRLSRSDIINEQDIVQARKAMEDLKRELTAVSKLFDRVAKISSFEGEIEKLSEKVNRLMVGSQLPVNKLARLGDLVEEAYTDPRKLSEAREYYAELVKENRRLNAERRRMEKEASKRGNLLGQSTLLMGKSIQSEQLHNILKTVDALKSYEITQVSVNNATNSWSARVRDADGLMRTLSGTIDKATGELYQHGEALSLVARNATKTANALGSVVNRVRLSDPFAQYFPDTIGNTTISGNKTYINPGGDTHSFAGSVVNTMRYITAGAIMGYPTMLLHQSFESAKEFDYQLAKALQNFEIKFLDSFGNVDMSDLARELLYQKYGNTKTYEEREVEVGSAVAEIRKFMTSDVVKALQNIAVLNGIDQELVGKAYHIASRRYDDPYEALAFAREVAKVGAIEEVDIEQASLGFEAISSQWGISGYDLRKVANMLIMASNISQATIEDLIETQQRAGAIFRQNLPGMTKEQALANSIAMSSMFVQATARTGTEGGTFWRNVIQRPFTRKGREALLEMSAFQGFEQLNPFNADGTQKDFPTLFADIIETSLKLDDKSRIDLWKSLIPQWHEGSTQAVSAFIQDLQHTMERVMTVTRDTSYDTDGDGNISIREAIQGYVSQIQSADEETAMLVRAGLMDTWKFRQNQLRTSWQVATYNVWEQLKGEFATLATYLSSFLRIIRDNADSVAGAIETIGKIMGGVAMRFAWNKLGEIGQREMDEKRKSVFENYGRVLSHEGRLENLRRIALLEEYDALANRRQYNAVRRQEIEEELDRHNFTLLDLQNRKDSVLSEIGDLRGKGVSEDSPEIASRKSQVSGYDKEIALTSNTIQSLTNELKQLETQDNRTANSMKALEAELIETDNRMLTLSNKARALTMAMEDEGLETSQLRQHIDMLTKEVAQGTFEVERFDKELRQLGADAGLTDDGISKLRKEIDLLTTEFKEGSISAKELEKRLLDLNRAHKLGSIGIGGGVAEAGSATHKGMGLAELVMTGYFAKELIGGKIGGRSIIQRFKDFRQSGRIGTLFSSNAPMRDASGQILRDRNGAIIMTRQVENANKLANAGKVANVGKLAAIGSAVGKVGGGVTRVARGFLPALRAIPGLGLAMIGMDAIGAFAEPLMELGLTGTEKKSLGAQKKEELAQKFANFEDAGFWGSITGAIGLGWSGLWDGLSNMFGGSSPSWGDYLEGFKAVFNNEGADAVKQKLAEEYNYEVELIEAKIEAQKELNEQIEKMNKFSPLDTNKDGLLTMEDGTDQVLDFESLNDLLTRINNQLSKSSQENEVDYQLTRTRLLISGVREDSQQLRDLMREYLNKNIAFLDSAIKELRESRELMAPSEQRDQIDAEINDKLIQRAQMELQLDQIKYGAIDELKTRMSDELELSEAGYDIQYYKLLARNGGKEDSLEALALQKAKLQDVNSQLENFKAQFQYLLDYGGLVPGSESYLEVLKSIRNIELQQAKNLVEINKKIGSQMSTFNLPSGLKVMDYYDYMTQRASHKSVTVGAGNVTVNVQIDNLSGSAKDAEKVASEIAKRVKDAQRGLVVQMANDVKSNMGSTYRR